VDERFLRKEGGRMGCWWRGERREEETKWEDHTSSRGYNGSSNRQQLCSRYPVQLMLMTLAYEQEWQ
jgi:hypothetical protein